jgi:hypothetical protein
MPDISISTTAAEADRLYTRVVPLMEAAGIEVGFIVEATTLALFDQGVYELMALWLEEESERVAIVQNLEQILDEYRRLQPIAVNTRLSAAAPPTPSATRSSKSLPRARRHARAS